MSSLITNVGMMEPMLPAEDDTELSDLSLELVDKSSRLAGQIHPVAAKSIGDLVRKMNCYYSNFIEGSYTHPLSIEKALARDFSKKKDQRDLQREAVAHIAVQEMIDKTDALSNIVTSDYIKWIHKEFCNLLPKEMLVKVMEETGEELPVVPGEFRTTPVAVGGHVPPDPKALPRFMKRFEEAYNIERLPKIRHITAVAAAHHRLAWIHPFLDGNGRVTRLFSHAVLKKVGVGSSLWAVSRGLGRSVDEYKRRLQAADENRRGDLDGRGTLSEAALKDFCVYFIRTCIGQVEFMGVLFAPTTFLGRVRRFVDEEVSAGRLGKGSYQLIREAWHEGEFERGRAAELTGFKEAWARRTLKSLVERKILVSDLDKPKGPVHLNFPYEVAERWFPNLYPENMSLNPKD